MKKTNCKKCGIEFSYIRSANQKDAQYCSVSCWAGKKQTKNCERCNKEFKFWATTRPNAKYCSRVCLNTINSINKQKKYREEYEKLTKEEKIIEMKRAFESHVIRKNDCWDWKGYKHRGYGKISYRTRNFSAHRFSYLIHKGAIPDKKMVLHKCDNPPCTNPDHLFLGDALTNCRDKFAKGRGNPMVGYRILTNEQVIEIRKLLDMGVTNIRIAADYNVTESTICDIKKRRTWKHLT